VIGWKLLVSLKGLQRKAELAREIARMNTTIAAISPLQSTPYRGNCGVRKGIFELDDYPS